MRVFGRIIAPISALLVAIWAAIYLHYQSPSYVPLSTGERAAVMHALRAALLGKKIPTPELSRVVLGPLLVTVYDHAQVLWQREEPCDGAPLGSAIARQVEALSRSELPEAARARARIKVDLVRSRAPIFTRIAPLFALSLVPGIDGVGLEIGAERHLIFPDELLRDGHYAAYSPVGGMDVMIGLDTHLVMRRLLALSGLSPRAFRNAEKSFFRFRTDSFIEAPSRDGHALVVTRGSTPGPEPSRKTAMEAARAGGDYLVAHLDSSGQFDYEYDPLHDHAWRAGYSLPRHAGATHFLAELHGATGAPQYAEAFARAAGFLDSRTRGRPGAPEMAWVGEPDAAQVDLGSTALTLAALVEWQRTTGDRRYEGRIGALAEFLLFMQKPNGDFCHLYDPAGGLRNETAKMLYYSGEAAFALGELTELSGVGEATRYRHALERALHYLTVDQYATFASQFFFLEDHWTCMAADAGWEALPEAARTAYADFCEAFGAFLRRTQFTEEDAVVRAEPDFRGAYGFSPFLPPHVTPVGSRTETALSIYRMARRRAHPTDALHKQIEEGARFLLAHQISEDSSYLMADPARARGGVLMSDVSRFVRIDFVQHACSALLRAVDLL